MLSKNVLGLCFCIAGSLVFSLDLFILKVIHIFDQFVSTQIINHQSYLNMIGYLEQPVICVGLLIPIIIIIIGIIFLFNKNDDEKLSIS